MASEQAVLDAMGNALWYARPTGNSDIKAQQLAWALGYPPGWRVVRTVEEVPIFAKQQPPSPPKQEEEEETKIGKPVQNEKVTMEAKKYGDLDESKSETAATTTEATTSNVMGNDETKLEAAAGNMKEQQPPQPEARNNEISQLNQKESSAEPLAVAVVENELCIVDRIYAGKPDSGCDMWFNHHAAMAACADYDEQDPATCDPFRHKGGHLLPRQPLFEKGDKVQVLFDGDWWNAKILRRKEHTDGFRYQVFYGSDKSKQNNIPEERIRKAVVSPDGKTKHDPYQMAKQLGFGDNWQAVSTGNNRWKITAPNGQVYKSKKVAMEAFTREPLAGSVAAGAAAVAKADDGDPPWRRENHEYLGRLVRWSQQHAVSARRVITVEQVGRVTGWISETDVDKAGEPGFVSERTGRPAALFHVYFDDEPAHLHPYAQHLVESQDLELEELEACLIPEHEKPPKNKKARK